MVELCPGHRDFTWSNNQENLIHARIDRVFATTEWDAAYPLARVKAIGKGNSDDTPLLLNTGDNIHSGKKIFRFEKWWLERDDFVEVVKNAWEGPIEGSNPMDVWQERNRKFRKLARGWAANVVAARNERKAEIAEEYNRLDIMSEHVELSTLERERE